MKTTELIESALQVLAFSCYAAFIYKHPRIVIAGCVWCSGIALAYLANGL